MKPSDSYDVTPAWMIWALVAVIGSIYFLTIRPDQDWSEDYALYIQHAKNLLAGLPYSHLSTPYPGYENVFRYPPGFPVLLMPVLMIYGVDLYAMKVLEVLFFSAVLLVLGFGFRRILGTAGVLALVILVGANPAFWMHKDAITSDFPFLLMCFVTLVLLVRKDDLQDRYPVIFVLAAAVMIYIAYSIRTAAVVLPLALVTYELMRWRRIQINTLAIVAGAALLAWIQSQLLATEASYGNPAAALTRAIGGGGEDAGVMAAAASYFVAQVDKWRWVLARFFDFEGLYGLGVFYFYGVVIVFAAYGYLYRLIKCFSVYEIFFAGYLAIFMVTGFGSYERYMFPTVVLLLFYMIVGIQQLPRIGDVPKGRILASVLAVGMALYAHAYMTEEFNELEPGVESPDALALFEFLRNETPPDAVFLTQNPQATSLFTDRVASRYNKVRMVLKRDNRYYHDLAQGWAHFDRVNASYMIAKRTDWEDSFYYSDQDFIDNFIGVQPDRFEEIYRNDSFLVFKILR